MTLRVSGIKQVFSNRCDQWKLENVVRQMTAPESEGGSILGLSALMRIQ